MTVEFRLKLFADLDGIALARSKGQQFFGQPAQLLGTASANIVQRWKRADEFAAM